MEIKGDFKVDFKGDFEDRDFEERDFKRAKEWLQR